MKKRIIDIGIKATLYVAFLIGFYLPVHHIKMGDIIKVESMAVKSGGMVLIGLTALFMVASLVFAFMDLRNKLYAHSVTVVVMGIMTFFTLTEAMSHRRFGSFTVTTGNAPAYMAVITFVAFVYILASTKRSI